MTDRINETVVPSVSDAAALVKRLRMPRHDLIEPHAVNTQCRRIPFLIDERVKAAAAIESLVARLAEVTAERDLCREALRPFADGHDAIRSGFSNGSVDSWLAGRLLVGFAGFDLKIGDLRRAAAALRETGDDG